MNAKKIEIVRHFPTVLREIGQAADDCKMQVYVVGGYVRDLLLKRPQTTDLDFTVVGDAPEFAKQLKRHFRGRNLVIYKRFGTAMLEIDRFKFEFVTARQESYVEDSRKPEVRKADLQSDLSRRDFTINTLAVGLNEKNYGVLYDPFGGMDDLKRRVIRTPLDPEMTFNDDPLRILRAIRFATILDFLLEKTTADAIRKMAERLNIVSRERIAEELMKILAVPEPSKGFRLLDQLNVLPVILPELEAMKGTEQRNSFHHKDVFEHTLKVVDNVAAKSDKLALRLAALFHDVAKPRTKRFDPQVGWTFHGHDEIGARMMEKIGSRLRLSKETKEYIQKLIRLHLRPIFLATEEVTDSAIRRLIVQAGDDLDDLMLLCRADITSGNPKRVRKHLQNFDYVIQRVKEVREKDELRKFQSPVRGDKIMEVCGIPPGPLVGKIKHAIEEAILDGLIPNEYEAALDYLYRIKDNFLEQIKSEPK